MTDPVLICGGAGFIGTNVAARLCEAGAPVLVYDDLSRPGVERNIQWLRSTYGSLVDFERGDIRDSRLLRTCVRQASAVYHFAAQTAVTTSVVSPRNDFDVNAVGAITLLEELRQLRFPIPLLFTSTNKVYGDLNGIALRKRGSRYEPQHSGVLANGIDEKCALSFHSPYGCSKGAADQYVLDYARTYGLPNVVFRMSCIYGPHQCGTEDQGWVAHFLLQAISGRPISLYGDGMQVRDVLYVDDLVDAMLLAQQHATRLKGEAFNIGGGPRNTTSLLELIELIGELEGEPVSVRFDDWRVGDQRYYVSDTRRFQTATGWKPRVGVREGVQRLHQWLLENNVASTMALQRGVA
ncbi:MAG TPA: NAD-dependent epimerase/dehydratase family protein [Bryobacteraceae bacterium]|nr:NAD-dependent epimerase/dehydratase family protein [Bryobacteraceae bacterium]